MSNAQLNKPKGLKIQDVVFILLRHKWKILICGGTGLVLAATFYLLDNPGYQATAKLLVRYVAENRGPEPEGNDRSFVSTAGRVDTLLNNEVHLLTSLDTAAEVARAVGPGRILSDELQQTNLPSAIRVVAKGLSVEIPRRSTRIMVIGFRHPEPDVAHDVLEEVVDHYMKRHFDMYRAHGAYEFLSRQTDQLRSRLVQTEEDLKRLKAKANIVSLEDSKAAVNERLGESKRALDEARAELASRKARVQQWEGIFEASENASETNVPIKSDPALISEYRSILELMAELKRKQQRLSSIYTDSNALVRLAGDQINEQVRRKELFEAMHPEVMASAVIVSGSTSEPGVSPDIERAEIAGLIARITELHSHYDEAAQESELIASVETDIIQLERRKELDETNYRYFAANLEKARIDEALDPANIPNISKVQQPAVSKGRRPELQKICMMIAFAGFGVGIGLAFFIELVVDQTYKRPEEIEVHASLPLLLSIPYLGNRRPQGVASAWRKRWFSQARSARSATWESDARQEMVPTPTAAGVNFKPYCEALRDRMMLFFQLKKMVHKPKLVAVTGCSEGAGKYAGVRAGGFLSETGAGKVLLVDMNLGKGVVHPFHQGVPARALPDTFSEEADRSGDEQMVDENLYLASAGDAKTRQALMLPKRFGDLIPRMRASDYDYIIFDMPPVSQTAATLTLSSFMDQVLLVIEAEKSPKENVQKAASLLQQSGTNVFGVFNKSTTSRNGWLQPKL